MRSKLQSGRSGERRVVNERIGCCAPDMASVSGCHGFTADVRRMACFKRTEFTKKLSLLGDTTSTTKRLFGLDVRDHAGMDAP